MQIRKAIQIHLKNLQQLSFFFLTSSSFPDSCRKAIKKVVLFSNQDKRISTDLLGWVKLHRASLICLPGRNGVFDHQGANTEVCTLYCESMVDYHLFITVSVCMYGTDSAGKGWFVNKEQNKGVRSSKF